MRSAARLIGRVSKFDHISAYMLDVHHWLPLRQRIEFGIAVLVWYSLIGRASICLPCWPFLPFPYRSEYPPHPFGGPPSCKIFSHLHHAEPGLLRGSPL